MMSEDKTPLCVDLDGTLTPTDLLFEHILCAVRNRPWLIFFIPFWMMRGRLYTKRQVVSHSVTNPLIPLRQDLLDYLQEQKAMGRKIYLVTASPIEWATQVAESVSPLFDEVIASDTTRNLKGKIKAQVLVERFGEKGFVYFGDCSADWPIFEVAKSCIPVGSKRFTDRVGKQFELHHSFPQSGRSLLIWLKAIRVHQWAKNLLIFLPVFLSHSWDLASFGVGALAFVSFSLLASSIYLINDLLDLQSDRLHPKKANRPLAAAKVPIPSAAALSVLLMGLSFTLGLFLPLHFLVVLVAYFITTSLYSFWLKSKLLIDVILLTGLFTLRIYAGSAATGIPISEWLLAFSLFIFFSLALLKRYIEILRMKEIGKEDVSGRSYQLDDQHILAAIGGASGLMATLVMTIYLSDVAAQEYYRHPEWLLGVTVLLMYWISRIWVLAHRGEVDDDPIVFALKDKQSVLIGGLTVLLMWIASI